MSTETRTQFSMENRWIVGGISGLIAGIVFGIMLQIMMTSVLSKGIPALYGMSGLSIGWILHLFHSIVFGLIFVGILSVEKLKVKEYTDKYLLL